MNIYSLSVSRSLESGTSYPLITFRGSWLADIGFTPGALVQALPEPGGISLILCGENTQEYKEFSNATRKKNGSLIHVFISKTYGNLQLCFIGRCIRSAGLEYGDALLAQYRYGLINVRKLPDKTKFIPAGKYKLTGKHALKIRLSGIWLSRLGFIHGALVTADAKPGSVTFSLQEKGVESYKELTMYARKNRMRLLQVKGYANIWHFEIDGPFLETTGFCIDDAYLAAYDYGVIRVVRCNFEQLGFK